MKKAIFTVLMDGYDHMPKPAKNNPTWDKILFIDEDLSKYAKSMWTKVIKIDYSHRPDIASRDIKWRSHIHLPEYDLVCYHDANMQITQKLPEEPFRIIHPRNKSVREEADLVISARHRWAEFNVEEQMRAYEEDGFPDDLGLYMNGFFARYHSDEENELCEIVFDHVQKYTSRDQFALPYAMWKTGYKQGTVYDKSFYASKVRYKKHIKASTMLGKAISVHHITPGRSDRNFGKALNDIIRGLPDHDWICLRDIDTLPLDHVSFIRQCEEIANKGEYGMVSCLTNRLGLDYQLVYDKLQPEDGIDMDTEITKAKEMAAEHGSEVVETHSNQLGGVMMLFPKQAWIDVGEFREGGIIFGRQLLDNIIHLAVKNAGYKAGIAIGIYLFHIYRWKVDRKNRTHLRAPIG